MKRISRAVAVAAACIAAAVGPASSGRAAPSADADALLPATVRVAAERAYLRAGPGDDFYPTEVLPTSAAVELWAFDASGYGAVRPVAGSYSWIRAADIDDEARLDDAAPSSAERVGVIVADGAVARIGSQLNDLRHVAQVRLEAGERVRILEEVRIESGRHAGLWVRIEPPAGEFRWVRLTDLALPPELAAFVPRPAAAQPGAATAALEALKDAGAAVASAVEEVREAATAGPALSAAAPPTLEAVPESKGLFGGWLPLGNGILDATTRPAPVAVGTGGGAAATDELADIDLALSLAVTGPPEQMNLAQLRERLRLAAAKTTSQADRLRAEAIDARLTRFEAIHSKYQAIAATAPTDSPLRLGTMWSSLSAIGTRPVRPGVLPGGAPADGQPTWTPPTTTETTGRLATVVSRRPDAPRWAIVDEHNTVLVFVTPQAGLNLAPLVGQQVSVRGAQGYMPEYKRPYLVASEARPRLAAVPQADGELTR